VTRLGLRLMLLALVVWCGCFWLLQRTGNWLHFAFAGSALGIAVLVTGAVPKALLQPTPRALLAGVLGGVSMVGITHLGYRLVALMWPSVVPETGALLALLNVVGSSGWTRTLLIATIASSEELTFRGLLPATPGALTRPRVPNQRQLLVLGGLTLLYALTSAPLGSGLLVGCALVCGLIWGVLRLATGSVLVPILAHVIWDLGVMLLWPLPTQG
jgi:membrane protease YdiL (CAAX protease family)